MDKEQVSKSVLEMLMTGGFFSALVVFINFLTQNNTQRKANQINEDRLELEKLAADRKDAAERRAEIIADRDKEKKRADEKEAENHQLEKELRALQREYDKQQTRCDRTGRVCELAKPPEKVDVTTV